MSVLDKLIAAAEQIQVEDQISLGHLIVEIKSLLKYYEAKASSAIRQMDKHEADYVDTPWF